MKEFKGKLSILVPAHNEGPHIYGNIREMQRVFNEIGCQYELIIIDDGSKDETYENIQKAAISTAAYKAIAIPIAGCLGAIFAGFVSDRFFQSRRAPIAVIMLFLLGLSAWLYPRIPARNWALSLLCLLFIGFMTYGPHVLMVGTVAMDFATRKAASSAAGFIDCFGYIGAAITGVGSSFLVDRFNWNAAFYLWIAGALFAAILMAFLWNYKPAKGKYH